jgi:hypothetical protein
MVGKVQNENKNEAVKIEVKKGEERVKLEKGK